MGPITQDGSDAAALPSSRSRECGLLPVAAVSERALSSLIIAALLATAHADDAPAPVPGAESGIVVAETAEPSTARQLARAALFVPKVLVEVALLPVRGGVWLYDRYQLRDLYYRMFYAHHRKIGIVPAVSYQTGFGILVGAELVSKDMFGERERLTIKGLYGGTYQARVEAWLDSGELFGPLVLRGGGNLDRFGRLPFYGIGDPDMAVEARYRYQELRAAVSADLRLLDDVLVVGRGAITDITTADPTHGTAISEVYDPAMLVGFDHSIEHLYGELELRWDTRRVARAPWETTPYTTGSLVRGLVGRVHDLEGRSDFTHYAVDLQHLLHLGLGPRTLALRLWAEGVTGQTSDVPFTELPYLGGDFLRGYDFARFRDRVAVVGTVQYLWDLSRFADAFVFADGGRVYSSIDAVTWDHLRVGYGGGIALHGPDQFLIAGTLASSIDGGLFVTATLTPLWNETPRWR